LSGLFGVSETVLAVLERESASSVVEQSADARSNFSVCPGVRVFAACSGEIFGAIGRMKA